MVADGLHCKHMFLRVTDILEKGVILEVINWDEVRTNNQYESMYVNIGGYTKLEIKQYHYVIKLSRSAGMDSVK